MERIKASCYSSAEMQNWCGAMHRENNRQLNQHNRRRQQQQRAYLLLQLRQVPRRRGRQLRARCRDGGGVSQVGHDVKERGMIEGIFLPLDNATYGKQKGGAGLVMGRRMTRSGTEGS